MSIPAAELAALQTAYAISFDRVGVIYRPTNTTDGQTHRNATFVAQNGGAALPCSVGEYSASDAAEYGEELGVKVDWRLKMGNNVDLRQGDRVVVTSMVPAGGTVTYQVHGVNNQQWESLATVAHITEVQWAPEYTANG